MLLLNTQECDTLVSDKILANRLLFTTGAVCIVPLYMTGSTLSNCLNELITEVSEYLELQVTLLLSQL